MYLIYIYILYIPSYRCVNAGHDASGLQVGDKAMVFRLGASHFLKRKSPVM